MGIYDRDYYRREGPSFLGAITSTGRVCKWLIFINVVFFLIQLVSPRPKPEENWAWWDDVRINQQLQFTEQEWRQLTPQQQQDKLREIAETLVRKRRQLEVGWFTNALVLDPEEVLHGQVWRLLTYAFLHDTASLWHILFNMLFLWWFGSDVETLYGPKEFLAFYLVSAVAGGLAFMPWALMQADGVPHICLGASGAVTAVMVLFALHYPSRMIYIWFILPVPIWLFVAFQVAQDSFIFLSGVKSKTAVTVHLGGAAFAGLYYLAQWRLLNLLPDLRAWRRQRGRPRLRVYREEPSAAPVSVPAAPSAPEVDEHLEAKVDAVLQKVAQFGKDSLTESERQLLLRASEIYRRRRT